MLGAVWRAGPLLTNSRRIAPGTSRTRVIKRSVRNQSTAAFVHNRSLHRHLVRENSSQKTPKHQPAKNERSPDRPAENLELFLFEMAPARSMHQLPAGSIVLSETNGHDKTTHVGFLTLCPCSKCERTTGSFPRKTIKPQNLRR